MRTSFFTAAFLFLLAQAGLAQSSLSIALQRLPGHSFSETFNNGGLVAATVEISEIGYPTYGLSLSFISEPDAQGWYWGAGIAGIGAGRYNSSQRISFSGLEAFRQEGQWQRASATFQMEAGLADDFTADGRLQGFAGAMLQPSFSHRSFNPLSVSGVPYQGWMFRAGLGALGRLRYKLAGRCSLEASLGLAMINVLWESHKLESAPTMEGAFETRTFGLDVSPRMAGGSLGLAISL